MHFQLNLCIFHIKDKNKYHKITKLHCYWKWKSNESEIYFWVIYCFISIHFPNKTQLMWQRNTTLKNEVFYRFISPITVHDFNSSNYNYPNHIMFSQSCYMLL